MLFPSCRIVERVCVWICIICFGWSDCFNHSFVLPSWFGCNKIAPGNRVLGLHFYLTHVTFVLVSLEVRVFELLFLPFQLHFRQHKP